MVESKRMPGVAAAAEVALYAQALFSVLGVGLWLCAIKFGKRPPWVRGVVTTIELRFRPRGPFDTSGADVGVYLSLPVAPWAQS